MLYEVYITPGLILLIQLFNGMQSSLSMVYDREMGNMRTLLVSPLPRWYLLSSKLVAGMIVSLPHPKATGLRVLGVPIRLHATPGKTTTPPPLLGQHTESVLRSVLGLGRGDVNRLRKAGAL